MLGKAIINLKIILKTLDFKYNIIYNNNCSLIGQVGDIAQLARAPALQAGGPGFESLYLHQRKFLSLNLKIFSGFPDMGRAGLRS